MPSVALAQTKSKFASVLTGFSTEAELRAFIQTVADDPLSDLGIVYPHSDETEIQNEERSVTKLIGDTMIVLRHGELYAVDTKVQGQAKLTDSISIPQHESLKQNVWYDDLLVNDDIIYVVGYRYLSRVVNQKDDDISPDITSATEFSSFRLKDGKLTRLKSTFFEFNDYFSAENFGSRIVNGGIVAFMPFFLHKWENGSESGGIFPTRLNYRAPNGNEKTGTFVVGEPVFGWRDVVRPAQFLRAKDPEKAAIDFETVLSCRLPKDGSLDCRARALLAHAYARFYMSDNHVFLWGEDRLAAFDINTLEVATHKAKGYVTDEFAFSEKDGVLRVAIGASDGSLRILRAPISSFSSQTNQTVPAVLISEKIYRPRVQRWMGDWYLGAIEGENNSLVVYNDSSGATKDIEYPNPIQKIEAMPGIGALVVAEADGGITAATIKLEKEISLMPAYRLEKTAVTKTPDGFYFQPSTDGGYFEVSVQEPRERATTNWCASPTAMFLGVNGSGKISKAGRIVATESDESMCEAARVEWYGNASPVFVNGRIFVPMGGEISEASIASRIAETDKELHLTEHGKRVKLAPKTTPK